VAARCSPARSTPFSTSLREKLAAGALLAQFYMGVENVLKRISKYRGVALPQSPHWHADLLERFAPPPHDVLPALLDEDLLAALGPYRRFRHVMHHAYGFDLDWERMREGAEGIEPVFERFRERVTGYLRRLP
jgi:hypothetical protein